jgi:hypothetical protein
MKIYQLAFFKDDDHISIPGILPIDMPDELPSFPYGERLTMTFAVEKTLPPSIVCRLIVLRHKEIVDEKHLWRRGAVLHYVEGDAVALVKEDGRNVTVCVKGTNRTSYVASLRETLKDIFESYKELNPDLLYEVLLPEKTQEELRCEKFDSKFGNELLMLKEEVIKGCLRKSRQYFDAPNGRDIPLDKTVQFYAITSYIFQGDIENLNIQTGHFQNDDHSTHTIYNVEFNNCIVNFQGELNSLIKDLLAKGLIDDADFMKEIIADVEETQTVIRSTPETDIGSTLKKKGLLSKLKDFYDEFTDEDSALNKNITKLRNGTKKLQRIGRVYNDFVRLIPVVKAVLPEIPESLLKGKDS